jgi:predicted RNA binding protein YcfA (HicA-like mRNA interferase family)
VNQEGSHVILQTESPACRSDHKTLRLGTLNSILRAVARVKGIEKEDILERL